MEKLLNFFKILSDETRFRIIMLLYNRECCVCEMAEILKISQPNVSRNLSKLKDLEIVRGQRQGQLVFYYLNKKDDLVENIIEDIHKEVKENPIILQDLRELRRREDEGTMCVRE
ncbi:regulatory protein, ArsR [Alkaliphilus metalliredigens QYMF]|uniref:Regulatory protein, ArsR n=1 Tax=Alkaliphilus metalliredigens (strain QYMF) TaxID=293826 RepID=A6TP93_ALKMQ|nr:metalloregulator ArsR/SmtB family transcription factor [Alkaliphilus metalliredigens]ABR48011.1 regulatory protein, ArsR [Alkaliphilus metalliredigens QYMF]